MKSRRREYLPVGRFERATSYCPLMVADHIVWEAELYFRQALPARFARQLALRAERVLANNDRMRRKFAGKNGHAYLTSFLRHWLTSLLAKERPSLYERLPDSFKIGHPLPLR
jgi:hypothetical protein